MVKKIDWGLVLLISFVVLLVGIYLLDLIPSEKGIQKEKVCISNEPNNINDYSEQVLLDIGIVVWDYDRKYEGSIAEFREIFTGLGFTSSGIIDEGIFEGAGGVISDKFSTSGNYIKVYRIPDKCNDYINEIKQPSGNYYSTKYDVMIHTRGNLRYWCTGNWYLWETNDEDLIDIFYEELGKPKGYKEYTISKTGDVIYSNNAGGFLVVNRNNKNIGIFSDDLTILDRYFDEFYRC